jgi:hypothetical protein
MGITLGCRKPRDISCEGIAKSLLQVLFVRFDLGDTAGTKGVPNPAPTRQLYRAGDSGG